MSARRILPLLLSAAIAAAPLPLSSTTTPAPPNIVFILTDDLDTGSLDRLPRIHSLLADEGTSFSSFFVSDSLCCPSRSTILLGQYDHNHHVVGNFSPEGGFRKFLDLGHESSTVATWLHDDGYRTGLLGKYLNGYPDPSDRTHVPPGWNEWDSPSGGSPYEELGYELNENGTLVSYDAKQANYLTDVLAQKAVRFIQQSAADPRPFFLYVATFAPHLPATPPERYRDDFKGATAPRTASFNEKNVDDKPEWLRATPSLDERAIDRLDEIYRKRLQTMEAVEDLVSNVIDALSASNRLANTYIVFTSDNGFHMGQHRLVPGKQTPYEEDIRVPLIVRGPGVPAAAVRTELAGNVDLPATFADLAGIALPPSLDGRSLLPLLGGGPTPSGWRAAYLLEHAQHNGAAGGTGATTGGSGTSEPADPSESSDSSRAPHPRVPSFQGLRTADALYVEYADGERELYDLRLDPDQLKNIAATADRARIAALSAWLASYARCAGATCRAVDVAGPGSASPAM